MTQKTKGRTGWHQATPKTTYSRNHTSNSILVEHYCYCHPGLLCILCLKCNHMTTRWTGHPYLALTAGMMRGDAP